MEAGQGGGFDNQPVVRRTVSYFQKATGVEELLEILKAKYGTLMRAWRVALDTDESGLLDFREFSSALSAIGYVGNMRTLWFNLDDDNSGAISLNEIDCRAYQVLEKFRVFAGRKCGGMVNCWNQLLDQDKSGTVSLDEFREGLRELGYTNEDEDEVLELFGYLVTTPGIRYITLKDVKFLQIWEEQKQAAANRKRLPKAWVNRDPYMSPPKAGSEASGMSRNRGGSLAPSQTLTANPSMTTIATMPSEKTEEDWGSIVAFNEEKQKEAFLEFLITKFGSLPKAFDYMDANGSGQLSMVEFQTVVSSIFRYCRVSEARRLFLTFNADPTATLSFTELGITKPEWVNHILERRTQRDERANQRRGLDGRGAVLGRSPRQLQSYDVHAERLRKKPHRQVAFGMPLPQEWGFPPYFDPIPSGVKLPPLSAR